MFTSIQSAGILPYKITNGNIEVMLVHAGGPFWAKKENASWSIPKGLLEKGETVLEAALREFTEETSIQITEALLDLGSVKSGSKTIYIFAVNKDIDTCIVKSNTFEMEWPPKSGIMQNFPENDRAQWFSIDEAKIKIFKGQLTFLERLIEQLSEDTDNNP